MKTTVHARTISTSLMAPFSLSVALKVQTGCFSFRRILERFLHACPPRSPQRGDTVRGVCLPQVLPLNSHVGPCGNPVWMKSAGSPDICAMECPRSSFLVASGAPSSVLTTSMVRVGRHALSASLHANLILAGICSAFCDQRFRG